MYVPVDVSRDCVPSRCGPKWIEGEAAGEHQNIKPQTAAGRGNGEPAHHITEMKLSFFFCVKVFVLVGLWVTDNIFLMCVRDDRADMDRQSVKPFSLFFFF